MSYTLVSEVGFPQGKVIYYPKKKLKDVVRYRDGAENWHYQRFVTDRVCHRKFVFDISQPAIQQIDIRILAEWTIIYCAVSAVYVISAYLKLPSGNSLRLVLVVVSHSDVVRLTFSRETSLRWLGQNEHIGLSYGGSVSLFFLVVLPSRRGKPVRQVISTRGQLHHRKMSLTITTVSTTDRKMCLFLGLQAIVASRHLSLSCDKKQNYISIAGVTRHFL